MATTANPSTNNLTDFEVTLKMARSTGSLAAEVECRTFTVRGPALNAKHAEAIAFGLGHGINEATGYAWKFCGGSEGVAVRPAADGEPNLVAEVRRLRALLDVVEGYVGKHGEGEADVWSAREILAGRPTLEYPNGIPTALDAGEAVTE